MSISDIKAKGFLLVVVVGQRHGIWKSLYN